MVNSENTFFAATGVTSGELLEGVRYTGGRAETHSVVMRSKTGTMRFIEAVHRFDKLRDLADYITSESMPES